MRNNSLLEVEKLLSDFIPLVSIYGADGLSVQRISSILESLGRPQDKLKIIHVAGTSGKTSTAYFISSLLCHSKKTVGLAVSPHIYSITERVQINDENINIKLLHSELTTFLQLIKNSNVKPSYFELMMAFAIWEFAKQELEYAVIETGMGGLKDASNVLNSKDKVCVITDIGLDHMQVLGNDVKSIALHKAGIIHDQNHVFMNSQPKEVLNVITKVAKIKNAKLNVIKESNINIATKSQLVNFQMRNYKLANEVFKFISFRDKFRIKANFDLKNVKIPGRMEINRLKNNSHLIVDGAHNPQKMKVFVDSYLKNISNKKATVLVALKEGKNYEQVIDELLDVASKLFVTKFKSSSNLPSKSLDPKLISQYAKKMSDIEVITENDYKKATKMLLEDNSEYKIITGSFYLISQTKHVVKLFCKTEN
jgi:dihydrofolate synthase/folylpolyglutamate synthase